MNGLSMLIETKPVSSNNATGNAAKIGAKEVKTIEIPNIKVRRFSTCNYH